MSEEAAKNSVSSSFREGPDFSRAVKSSGLARASAPAVIFPALDELFPQPLKSCPSTFVASGFNGARQFVPFPPRRGLDSASRPARTLLIAGRF